MSKKHRKAPSANGKLDAMAIRAEDSRRPHVVRRQSIRA